MYQRENLFSKLGVFAYETFIESTRLCRTYRHEYVELEHWLKVLISQSRGDIPLLFTHYQVNIERLNEQLTWILSHMPNASTVVNDLSPKIELAVERGLITQQMLNESGSIRTVHILLGMLQDPGLQRWLYRLSDEFKKIPIPLIMSEFHDLLKNSVENEVVKHKKRESSTASPEGLLTWCDDLTQQARNGEIDPIIGRESELRQMIDILLRRRQNNPILVGEAGVGKTAVVEALARRIVEGNVPPALQETRLLSLDLGRLKAGAGARGEFEARLKSLIDQIQHAEEPIILFCDEAHTLVGAGGQAGTGDAVNLLKPLLARGALRMVAATTWSEYKEFIEPDAALIRRFQRVLITEPTEENAIHMLRAIAPYFAKHHGVMIRDSAIVAAVRLSLRHLPLRQLPDKAISLLDTACARVAISHSTEPQSIEQIKAEINNVQSEINSLRQEAQFGINNEQKESQLQAYISQLQQEYEQLNAQCQDEKQYLDAFSNTVIERAQLLLQWNARKTNQTFVHPWVDESVISEVLSDWTGILTENMVQNDLENVLNLEQVLGNHIFGQPAAIHAIAQRVQIAMSGVEPNDSPLGVFLLTGPSGTGKTETATALAEIMYGGAHNLITFNMSEFQEAHTVSILKGAPPGYVGYGKGGKLTEAVRQKPYSVILLDEFDKAHPDVHEMFYQVFDKGWMKDGEGRLISFKQCFILLTSNQGASEIEQALEQEPNLKFSELRVLVYEALTRLFSPALLARMNVIPYYSLDQDALSAIASKNLKTLQQHMEKEMGISLTLDSDVPHWIADKVSHHPNRGRAVMSLLRDAILPPLSQKVLIHKRDKTSLESVNLVVEDAALHLEFS